MKFLLLSQILLLATSILALTYDEALKLVSKDGLLHITEKNYRKFIKNENFALIVFLTSDDSRVVLYVPNLVLNIKQLLNNICRI